MALPNLNLRQMDQVSDDFLAARKLAAMGGHSLGHFMEIDGPLYLATCNCGALAFINLVEGTCMGKAVDAPCPKATINYLETYHYV